MFLEIEATLVKMRSNILEWNRKKIIWLFDYLKSTFENRIVEMILSLLGILLLGYYIFLLILVFNLKNIKISN